MGKSPFSLRYLIAKTALAVFGGIFAGGFAWDIPILTVLGAGVVIALILFFNSLAAIAGPNPRTKPIHGAITSTCLYLMAAVIIYCAVATVFASIAYSKAREYAFVVAPMMEKYCQTRGNYPENLSQIPGLPPTPRALLYGCWPGYKFEDGYHFTFNSGSFSSHSFSMRTKTWSPLPLTF